MAINKSETMKNMMQIDSKIRLDFLFLLLFTESCFMTRKVESFMQKGDSCISSSSVFSYEFCYFWFQFQWLSCEFWLISRWMWVIVEGSLTQKILSKWSIFQHYNGISSKIWIYVLIENKLCTIAESRGIRLGEILKFLQIRTSSSYKSTELASLFECYIQKFKLFQVSVSVLRINHEYAWVDTNSMDEILKTSYTF